MNVFKVKFVAVVIALMGLSAQAQDRYIVIYKSHQGFTAMNSFMKLESSKPWGLKKSLQNVKGMVLEVSDASAIEKLKQHPEVAFVEEEIEYRLPRPVNNLVIKPSQFKVSPQTATTAGDVSSFTAGQQTPWGIDAVKAPQAWKLSVDAGSKVRMAILDSGVDTSHPAISGSFEKGKNFSVKGPATDFTDDTGHGTHCSGTALGQYNEKTGFAGVAPNAKLLMGKVCINDICNNTAIVDAIDWAIQEKVDIISMSLGGKKSTAAERIAINEANKAGIFVVAASGNDAEVQPDGTITTPGVSFPGAFANVLAVGALDSKLVKSDFSNWGPELDIMGPGTAVFSSVPLGSGRESLVDIIINGQKNRIPSTSFTGAGDIKQPIAGEFVHVGLGTAADFATINVVGKMVLISRGDNTFAEKIKNAMAAKAIGAVVYNNAAGALHGILIEEGQPNIDFPVAAIEQAEGLKIVEALNLKTVVSAELATLKTDYAAWDGTSMATPHVAGVAALAISAYKASHGGKRLSPAAMRSLLKSTALKLAPNDHNEYGAGLVQADAAVQAAMVAP